MKLGKRLRIKSEKLIVELIEENYKSKALKIKTKRLKHCPQQTLINAYIY